MPEGDDPLRITTVAFRYPPRAPGGAGIYAHRLVTRLAARGHKMRVVAATDKGSETGHSKVDGIDVELVKVSSKPPMSKFTFVHNPGTMRKRFGEGDIAHVHNIGAFSTTLFSALKKQGGHRGIVWTSHDVQLISNRVPEDHFDQMMRGTDEDIRSIRAIGHDGGSKGRTIWKHFEPNTDRFIAPSRFMYNMLLAGGLDKARCRLVYNGMDLEGPHVSEVPQEPTILFLGGVVAIKGVDHLVEAMPRVLESVPEAKLRIVGKGDMEQPLRQRTKELGIEGRVVFEGHHEDVGPFYHDAMVVALPSVVYENCSLVLLESMAHGRPTVATDRGGNPELVEDGRTGLLVKAGDPEDLAEKLAAVLSSHDRAVSFGKAGRRRVEATFSMERAVDGSEKVYREILES